MRAELRHDCATTVKHRDRQGTTICWPASWFILGTPVLIALGKPCLLLFRLTIDHRYHNTTSLTDCLPVDLPYYADTTPPPILKPSHEPQAWAKPVALRV